jgi:8-oxo-dGTP pyrophosphatase MutT (NUDIX family)
MKLTEYVVVYPKLDVRLFEDEVLLVLKDRPDWQKGRYNLCGGKVEEGETAVECARRELMEEAGIPCLTDPIVCGQIHATGCIVYCCSTLVKYKQPVPREGETEKVSWQVWNKIKDDPKMLPNLQIIIPLLHMGATGWHISHEDTTDSFHEVSVQIELK